jgi:hypothetical protein
MKYKVVGLLAAGHFIADINEAALPATYLASRQTI